MHQSKSDHIMAKQDQNSRCRKNRMKSLRLRVSIGPMHTFNQFYQSGGRDLDQYYQWLKTMTKSKQLSTPSICSKQIKEE